MVFDSLSNDLGGFNEIITRNALDGVIEKSDVFCLLNHDKSKGVLARSNKGTGSLTLEIDDKGLKYRFEAPKTALGDELEEVIFQPVPSLLLLALILGRNERMEAI